MHHRLPVLLAIAVSLGAPAPGTEANAWPAWVEREDAGNQTSIHRAVGPLFEETRDGSGSSTILFRPFFRQQTGAGSRAGSFLYPFFTWDNRPGHSTFSFFKLVNHTRRESADGTSETAFDVWPAFFSRYTGDAEADYTALFPIAGTIKHRFGSDRLTWTAFPLYLRSEKSGVTKTATPWPFVRRIEGEGHEGLAVWPLFGKFEREGDYRRQFYLWPFAYKNESNLGAAEPDVKIGVLPFYTRDTGPGYRNESYVWPLFGRSHRTVPDRYAESRYLWPLLVQGHGDTKRVNRFGPFYTHSNVKGSEKTWIMWPLYRNAKWTGSGVSHEKDQLLFFLYWSLEQRSLANPDAAPAYKKHFWPLFSAWDNGAGRRQLQLISPIEVFLPQNEQVRQLYTPLFALYRFDQRGPGDARWSLLWDAVTWRGNESGTEFHIGPLFSAETSGASRRVEFVRGLFGFKRGNAGGWRPFLFDFQRKADMNSSGRSSP